MQLSSSVLHAVETGGTSSVIVSKLTVGHLVLSLFLLGISILYFISEDTITQA